MKPTIHEEIRFADSAQDFEIAVRQSSKNNYILSSSEAAIAERHSKLQYLYIDQPSFFDRSCNQDQKFFYFQNPDGLITACKDIRISPKEDERDLLWFQSTNVLPGYQHNGLATQLIRAALAYAQKEGFRIECSSFMEAGQSYLQHVYPRLHADFPDVLISYGGGRGAFISGHEPYTVIERYGRIEYEMKKAEGPDLTPKGLP